MYEISQKVIDNHTNVRYNIVMITEIKNNGTVIIANTVFVVKVKSSIYRKCFQKAEKMKKSNKNGGKKQLPDFDIKIKRLILDLQKKIWSGDETVCEKICGGECYEHDELGCFKIILGWYENEKLPEFRIEKDFTESICWDCSRSGKDCSWLADFTPVKGWDAVRSEYPVRSGCKTEMKDSYLVLSCPLFKINKKTDQIL